MSGAIKEAFDFESLYQRYPRKEGKKRGMDRLRKTIQTKAEYQAFATAVDAYVRLCRDENREPRYIKHWATFVNNWTDYLEQGVSAPQVNPRLTQLERILKGEL